MLCFLEKLQEGVNNNNNNKNTVQSKKHDGFVLGERERERAFTDEFAKVTQEHCEYECDIRPLSSTLRVCSCQKKF